MTFEIFNSFLYDKIQYIIIYKIKMGKIEQTATDLAKGCMLPKEGKMDFTRISSYEGHQHLHIGNSSPKVITQRY